MFDRGLLFWSRFRDGLTSIVMALLIWSGMDAISLLIATFATCALYYWKATKLDTPITETGTLKTSTSMPSISWSNIFYSNAGITFFTVWALFSNNFSDSAFGHSGIVVVRISVYFFQIMSIPSVLIVRVNIPLGWARQLRSAVFLGIGMLGVATVVPLELGSILAPVAGLFTLYASLGYMRATHK
jgi:hypothetical protein